MSSFVILAALVFEISYEKQANKQTNKHINAAENRTHATTVDMDNEVSDV